MSSSALFIIFLCTLFLTCLWTLALPLHKMGVKQFIDKISLTDKIVYGDIFSLGGGDNSSTYDDDEMLKLRRDVRVAIVYPFMWVIINTKKSIYVLTDSQSAPNLSMIDDNNNNNSGGELFNPCPSGNTAVKFNRPESGFGFTNMHYKCLPLSLNQLFNNAKRAYAMGIAERVYFKFKSLLDETTKSISLTDCINYLLVHGYMTNEDNKSTL